MRIQKKVSRKTAAPKKAVPIKKKEEPKQRVARKKAENTEQPEKNEQAKEKPNPILVNITLLAKVVGVEIRMIRHLQQQGVIEPYSISKGDGNKYDLLVCVNKIFRYYREKTDRTADEKLRQLAAKRELEEIKVKRARGELHHTEDIKVIFGSMFSRLHSGFESFPLGLATKVVDKTDVMEIAGEIKKQLDKILYEVTNYDIETLKANVGDYIAGLDTEEGIESDEQDN